MVGLAEKEVLLLMLRGVLKVYPPFSLLVKDNSQFPVLLSATPRKDYLLKRP